MIRNITHLTKQEMEDLSSKLADSFMNYEMTPGNKGMAEYLDTEHYSRLIRAYLEAAVRNGSLYCAGDHGEGYIVMTTPDTKGTLTGSVLQAWWSLRAYGLVKGIRQVSEIMAAGPFVSMEMKKAGKECVHIEIVAVMREYWHQGWMRRMMEFAMKEAEDRGLPLLLVTDDARKVKMYEHFGMKMVREHKIAYNSWYYDMLKE